MILSNSCYSVCILIYIILQVAEEGEVAAEAPVQDVSDNTEETEENATVASS